MKTVAPSILRKAAEAVARTVGNLLVATLLTALFLSVELYLYWLGHIESILWRKDDIGYIFAFFLFLRMSRISTRIYLAVFLLMLLLQFSEIAYHLFSRTFYGPAELALLSRQTDNDIWLALSDSAILQLFLVPFMVTAAAGSLVAFLMAKSRNLSFGFGRRLGYGLLVFWLLVPFVHAYTEDNSMRFDPDPGKTAFRNGINAISYFTIWDLLFLQKERKSRDYPEYAISKSARPFANSPINLVVIMGESITYTHMGLYGYARDTTPFLSSLARLPNFHYLPSVSSAVSTHVSIPMFYNIQYEPDNRTHIASGRSNLYRIAKAQGYQTAFLSSQEMYAIASQVSMGAVDTWKELKHLENSSQTHDSRLLAALEGLPLDWEQPFMLSLNPRAGHIPYSRSVPEEWLKFSQGLSKNEYDRYMRATYDDAMSYFDWVVSEIVRIVQQHTEKPTAIVITSDHGQRLGQSSGYGHNTLEFGSARVPFIYLGLNTSKAIDNLAKDLKCPATHYDAGRFIARLLGYEVESPTYRGDDSYFLNGVDISGRGGHLNYHRSEAVSASKCSNL